MRFSTFASILFGAGLQKHEGYADTNFKSFQSKEIENISSTEVKNVKKMLKTPTRQITQSLCSGSEVLNDTSLQLVFSSFSDDDDDGDDFFDDDFDYYSSSSSSSDGADDDDVDDDDEKEEKEVIRCFDTSIVTNMEGLFKNTGINADLSSWDVSSLTNMDVSYQSS